VSGLDGIRNLSSAVRYYANKQPNRTYVISNGKHYSYNQVDNFINRACSHYTSLGVKKGDIVSAVLRNDIEYIVMYLASLRYGAVFNPYPYTLDAKDIARYLTNIHPRVLLCQKRHYDELRTSSQYTTFLVRDDFTERLHDDALSWDDFVPTDNSPACLYYSSGTTGNPKSVLFSFQNMIANISSVVRGFRFDGNDIFLIVLPLGHTAAINYSFLPCTFCGATMVLTESFWKIRPSFWSLVKQSQVTYVELVPSILLALLNTPYSEEEYANIDSLRFIGCGSSTLPQERQIQFMEKYGVKVANLYGLSETGPTHIDYPLDKSWVPGSIGVPLDVNEVRIMDDEDHILSAGEIGEIVVKGENVFTDYYGNSKMYRQAVRNEYFHTGDLGYIDLNNKHYFVGRKKELIIKGGVNIAPDEIDEILYKIDKVAEAITMGKPDEYLGERIVSYIVLKEGSKLMKEDVLAHCRKYLSRNKIPDEVMFVDSIPKGHSGKLLRKRM
jgi:long-chain acyl-CoA synthetase